MRIHVDVPAGDLPNATISQMVRDPSPSPMVRSIAVHSVINRSIVLSLTRNKTIMEYVAAPSPKRPKCDKGLGEMARMAGHFAERFKRMRDPPRLVREDLAAFWRSLCTYEDQRAFVNTYLRAMGDICELVSVIGRETLRAILDENIERVRRRDPS